MSRVSTTAFGGLTVCGTRIYAEQSDAVVELVPSEDAAALARALRQLLAAPESAADHVTAARTRLEREFAVEPWLARYEQLYRDLLQ